MRVSAGRQPRRRHSCKALLSASTVPPSSAGAASSHSSRPRPVAPSVKRSSTGLALSLRPGVTAIVNDGMTRPPITHSISVISASAPCSGVTAGSASTPMTAR